MVTGLVQNLGREVNDGRRTFPTPEAMALMPLKFYTNEVRAGYRAPYFKELADRVASGNLDVEQWLHSPLSTADLIKEMRGVKGVGPYAAENLPQTARSLRRARIGLLDARKIFHRAK